MIGYAGSAGTDRWDSVQAAINAGLHSSADKRMNNCIPNMVQWIPMLEYYRQELPLAFLVVKAAIESCGNPKAGQDKMTDLGLFQLLARGKDEIQGFPLEQLLDPEINTIAFVGIAMEWRDSLLSSHAAWFPEGDGEDLAGILWLFGGIGSGATRHLMGKVGAGGNTFSRVVEYVKSHQAWMESEEADTHWGVQSGRLIAFRVMVAVDFVKRVRQLTASGELEQYIKPYTPITEGLFGGHRGTIDWQRGIGIGLAVIGAVGGAVITGWTVYQGLRRR